MKATLYDLNGKEKGKIDLPKIFSATIREDIVAKVLEAKKSKQPYGPNLMAGMRQVAKGKMRHRRHVWQTHYGKGMSRIPRKVMSQRGTQFNWEGAEVPFARGGKRAHPPKPFSMINTLKINKKEIKKAFESAISATANQKFISKKYDKIDGNFNAPFIIESGISKLKTKELVKTLKNILGEKIFSVVEKRRRVRAGKGKMRGRKYKSNAGMIIVVGEKEQAKTGSAEVINVKHLGVENLARGGLGRIAIYTEDAIKYLGEKK